MRFLFLLIITISGCHSGNTPQNLDDSTQLSVSNFVFFMEDHGKPYDKTKNILVIPGGATTQYILDIFE